MDPIVRSPYPLPPRLCAVQIVSGYTVRLTYANGVTREINLEPYLYGPIFDSIRNDPQLFAAAQVDEAGDTICWPNGADIAPETLYYDGEPPWVTPVEASRSPRKRGGRRLPKPRAARRQARVTA